MEYYARQNYLHNEWWENNTILEYVLTCFESSIEDFRENLSVRKIKEPVPLEQYLEVYNSANKPNLKHVIREYGISFLLNELREIGGDKLVKAMQQYNENITGGELTKENAEVVVNTFLEKLIDAIFNELSWVGVISIAEIDAVYQSLYEEVNDLTNGEEIVNYIDKYTGE